MKKKDNSIVILTGAGVSAESGIATFRASDGLWENHRIEEVATPEGFINDPMLVHTFYNQRRAQLLSPSIEPNAAHKALATLEQQFNGSVLIVTQNIDNLHERAGSKNVIHMHGELLKSRCKQTNLVYDCPPTLSMNDSCLCCQKTGNLRPHIVWFGEEPLQMGNIYHAIEECTLFAAIGTSGHVYPAAGLVNSANQTGATTVEINLEESEVANAFDSGIYGNASSIVPTWVENLIASD